MKFYAYLGTAELGQEPCGTENKILRQHSEYKTIRGFMRHGIPESWRGRAYRVYTFTNFYDPSTFTLVHRNDVEGPDFWDVSTFVSADSRRPVESKQFTGKNAEQQARAYAKYQEQRIKARGWTHIVTVNPGMVQKP